MAIAGKVAITLSEENDGKWSASVTYDKLVAVTHNNNLYISKKTSTNEEPTVTNEFWFLALKGFGGEDVQALIDRLNEFEDLIQAIIDGTTQVGNAKTLDGHGAEYFAPNTDLANYLPLDGSVPMYGAMMYGGGFCRLNGDGTWTAIQSWETNDGTRINGRYLQINNAKHYNGNLKTAVRLYDMKDGVETLYDILHTGNKPTGTYTGTGNTTEFRISTGGVGEFLVITGNYTTTLVSRYGAFSYTSSGLTKGFNWTALRFEYGRLYVATDDIYVNASTMEYEYQVL